MAGDTSSKGVPAARLAVIVTGPLLLPGGISLLLGFRPEIGIVLLVLFFVPVSFTMYNFWSVADPRARMGEMINLTKNLATTGALLALVALHRPWPFSLGK